MKKTKFYVQIEKNLIAENIVGLSTKINNKIVGVVIDYAPESGMATMEVDKESYDSAIKGIMIPTIEVSSRSETSFEKVKRLRCEIASLSNVEINELLEDENAPCDCSCSCRCSEC